MPIRVTLDRVLSERGMRARELARRIGITEANLSLLRNGKVRGVRFQTLAALCALLGCQPGDLLAYDADPGDVSAEDEDGNESS